MEFSLESHMLLLSPKHLSHKGARQASFVHACKILELLTVLKCLHHPACSIPFIQALH